MEPGDIVTYQGSKKIIVDISGDGYAVLRDPEDATGERLDAVPVAELS
jgi:hypothetical protein